ncbi:MAG: hypothetical protein HUU15_20145, partial [Candidatus Brocadiae bacterium]|nr:hypothetical protein [Candidatus Brocadiia bacterium]
FPDLRAGCHRAATAVQAARIGILLREMRASAGAYPDILPAGLEDPASGREFTWRRDGAGGVLTAPDGTGYRLKN